MTGILRALYVAVILMGGVVGSTVPTLYAQPATPDHALYLDSGARLILDHPGDRYDLIPGRDFTAMLWMRDDGTSRTTYPRLLSKRAFPRPAFGYEVFIEPVSGYPVILLDTGLPDDSIGVDINKYIKRISGKTPIRDAKWHHIALVKQQQTLRLYVDGRLDIEVALPVIDSDFRTDQPLIIGSGIDVPTGDSFGRYSFLKGEIDELSLWHRAVSQQEIRRSMYGALSGEEAGLAGYWPLNEERGTTAHDHSPHGHHGHLDTGPLNQGQWILSTRPTGPHWRETWWFYTLCSLGGLGLLFGLLQGYTARLRAQNRRFEALIAQRTAEVARQAEELRALDEAKSRFFANISHEFRTPLTLAMGPLNDVKTGRFGSLSPEARQHIDQALLNNRRLLRLVNQLLDVAKLEAHELHLHVRLLDLAAFLASLAQAFVPLAERKHITFTRVLPDEPTPLYADPDQLEKAVTNLLSNAFKFTPKGGCIALTAATGEDGVSIQVRDNGPGIPADHLPKIFDRFHQADTGVARGQGGTGIGLALAKKLVELHGGQIAVESAEGFGTTFTVTLPSGKAHWEAAGHVIAPQDEPDAPPLAQASETTAWTGVDGLPEPAAASAAEDDDRTTILVVDDNAEIRAFVRGHLREHYRVVEAADGAEGLALAQAITPDLIVSDVMMPEMDGYELCHALKQDPELDFIPVILLTAKASAESKLEGLGGGADDYLTKPFSTDELKARIHNLIAQRQRLRERFQATAAATSLPPLDVQSSDAVFLDGLRAAVEAHLSDETFTVKVLAEIVGMDRSHLYRRMQDLVGEAPSRYLWRIRLERAAQLLAAQAGTVSEIAYGVGFKSVPHFARRFRAHYGCSPTEYAVTHRLSDPSS